MNFDIYVSDDSSEDKTIKILLELDKENKLIRNLYKVNYRNPSKNFIETLKKIHLSYEYYFFCDQDDVWDREKIHLSIKKLEKINKDIPALFCTRTRIIDEKNNPIGHSTNFKKKPTLENALVQSIAGGNTMAFNAGLKNLIVKIEDSSNVVSHDWMAYMLATLFSGTVIYSSHSLVNYRKHPKNVIGPNKSLKEITNRIYKLLKGDFRKMTRKNIKIIEKFNGHNNQEQINLFKKMHYSGFCGRLKNYFKLKPYRQTFMSNLALFLAVVLKKF